AQQADPVVLPTTNYGESDTLYNLALQQYQLSYGSSDPNAPFEASEMIQKHGPVVDDINDTNPPGAPAPVTAFTQVSATKPFNAVGLKSFEGPGLGMSNFVIVGAPPDPTMAVSGSYVVAWVNSHYAVFDKNGNPLLPGNGFAAGNTLFVGVGGLCESTNRGDPILQYDRLADRWIFSQFAFGVNSSGNPITPYLQCFAVSTTNNPMGTYNRYVVDFSSAGFNDYGKLGVWPD